MQYYFKSKKDPLFGIIILGTAVGLSAVFIQMLTDMKSLAEPVAVVGLLITGLTAVLSFWLWLGTWYRITPELIYFRSGPFYGKIPVSSVHTIIVNKTMWNGYKPALARKGLIIKYNRYDDIYFAPDDNESFVQTLLTLNPSIKIVRE